MTAADGLTTSSGDSLPRISVVIPLYNKIAYIKRAIDSVLAQTYPHFELLVVDDGSTDGGGDVVRQYNDPRVRLIAQPNGGEGAARNRGVAEARFEWIGLLDADDEWLPRFLERTAAAIDACPSASVFFTDLISSLDGGVWLGDPRRGGAIPDFLRFYTAHDGHGTTSSSTVIRKQALLDAGGFPLGVRHGGDVDTWTRLALTGQQFYYVPEPLAIYYADAAGSVMKDGLTKVLDAPWVTVRTCRRWREEGRIPPHLQESADRMIQCMYIRYIRFLIAMDDLPAARKFLRENCVPSLCGRRRYLKTYLRSRTPSALMPLRRWIHRVYIRFFAGKR
jgi:glycosyltransferase involved in cell wall biosynthesis